MRRKPRYKTGRAYGLYNTIDFGDKWYGDMVQTVIKHAPDYMVLCLEHIPGFELDEDAEYELDNALLE